MGSTFEDTLYDFNLDLLPSSPNKLNKKNSILKLKSKICTISYAVSKYHETKEQFAQSEVLLLAAKEECKQVCIDYKESLEKCSQLEKDLKFFQKQCKDLEINCEISQNQVRGIESHSRQLQILVTNNEKTIEDLKKENQDVKDSARDYEKQLLSLRKENEILIRNFCLARDIVLGKKKLRKHHKAVLQNFDVNYKTEEVSSSESSIEETDLFDTPPSPLHTTFEDVITNDKLILKIDKNENCFLNKNRRTIKINEDHDSDCSNEIVSEDTGRGSSLAYSDGDKCFNSPDYYNNDIPFSSMCNKITEKRVLLDACTSPIIFNQPISIATSPLLFDDEALLSDNNVFTPIEKESNTEYIITDIPLSTEIVTIKEKKVLVDVGTNTVAERVQCNVSTSPIPFEDNIVCKNHCVNTATSPIQNAENTDIVSQSELVPVIDKRHKTIQNLPSQCEIEISDKSIKEKKCLERNNSKNLFDEDNNDSELEVILNTMQLTDCLITPIPSTPIKSHKKRNSNRHKSSTEHLNSVTEEHTFCREAIKLREENQVLHTNIADLTKDILKIKNILKEQNLFPESPITYNDNSSLMNTEKFDDSNDGIITIEIERIEENITENLGKNDDDACPVTNNRLVEEQEHEYTTQCQISNEIQSLSVSECQNALDNIVMEKSIHNQNNPTNTNPIIFIEEKSIEDSTLHLDGTKELLQFDNDKVETANGNKNKRLKSKKIGKLDKLKKKLLPKSKIKRNDISPVRKLQPIKKLKPVFNCKITEAEALLNNKLAYEKARKVMAELNLKKTNNHSSEFSQVKEIVPQIADAELMSNESNHDVSRRQSKEEIISPTKNIGVLKQPIICLPQVNLADYQIEIDNDNAKLRSPKKPEVISPIKENLQKVIITRSRSKFINRDCDGIIKFDNRKNNVSAIYNDKECDDEIDSRMRLKRGATDDHHLICKRVLRSQDVRQMIIDHGAEAKHKKLGPENDEELHNKKNECPALEVCSPKENIEQDNHLDSSSSHPKDSILCKMLNKYGKNKTKHTTKKVTEEISNSVAKNLEESIQKINAMPIGDKSKSAMIKLADEIRHSWNQKSFLIGLMKYLKEPTRKEELFNKINTPPAPPMTKSEQVLLFVIRHLEMSFPYIVNNVLTQIEFLLFQLNRTPEFDVIETLSHFYALLCRYFGLKNRLRLFILDAMYCLQFKVVPLIKQCLDVWMHILPLAHMGIAKSPLVTCLVYLLHFYKCEDRYNRVQDIRFILNKKYFYQISDWNETKILEMFRNAVKDLREIKVEKRMLRVALIIIAKRQGPKWCQKNIIKNMLLPIIEKEDVAPRIKRFCVELLGPLLKPYPMDMKVHCEILVNQLLDMLDQTSADSMKEAIFTSLIYMNKHNQNRVTKSLLSWRPNYVSPEFEELMRDFVREKTLTTWKRILSRSTL